MRKLKLLFLAAALTGSVGMMGQNLIDGAIPTVNSETYFSSSTTQWRIYNSSGTDKSTTWFNDKNPNARVRPSSSTTRIKDSGSTYGGSHLLIRWDGILNYVYSYPVVLEANKIYTYTMRLVHWNNSSSNANNHIKTGLNTAQNGKGNTIVTMTTSDENSTNNGSKDAELKSYSFNAIIDEAGTYYITLTNSVNGIFCITDDISMEESTIETYKSYWEEALNNANEAVNSTDNANISGVELTSIRAEISKSEPTTKDGYFEAMKSLQTATNAFVSAKSAYDSFAAEKANAIAIGVSTDSFEDLTSASGIEDKLKELYVLEDKAANATDYDIDATDIFGTWVNQNTGSASGEHWSEDSRSYINKYDGNGFTMSVTNTVTLPAGKYVFKAAARAKGVNGAFYMSVKIGDADAQSEHYNEQGNTGYGIDTSGAANYDAEGTYANDGKGRGWEWRFIGFELVEATSVKMQVYAQILGGNWVSFSDITLLTNSENTEICRQMWAAAKAAAETARDATDYTNVKGVERANLVSAINADVTASSAWYTNQKNTLNEAKDAFTTAKGSYDELATAITNATAKAAVNAGDGAFQIPSSAKTTLETAIGDANTTWDAAETTAAAATEVATTLNTAVTTFEASELNAPAAGVQYRLKATAAETADWRGKYYTMFYNSAQSQGQHSISANQDAADYLAQAWKFTAVEGEDHTNEYTLSMTDEAGATRYVCTAKTGYPSGSYTQIRTTTDASKALVVKVIATTGTNGRWFLQNTDDNSYIGGQDAGFYSNSQNYDLAIEAASQASVNVTIDAAVKYATRIFPFTPTLPTGVKAYSCGAKEGDVLTLETVETPAANTPYILYAENGVSSTDLFGWGTAAATSYTTGWLTGVYTSTTATAGTYVLQNNDDKVGFYLVAEGQEPTVGANRCYLNVSGDSKAAYFFDSEALGINAIDALTNGEAEIYNLNGVRLPSLQKGMNIIKMKNGKTQKVMVK